MTPRRFTDTLRADIKAGVPRDLVVGYARRHLDGLRSLSEETEGRDAMIAEIETFLGEMDKPDAA